MEDKQLSRTVHLKFLRFEIWCNALVLCHLFDPRNLHGGLADSSIDEQPRTEKVDPSPAISCAARPSAGDLSLTFKITQCLEIRRQRQRYGVSNQTPPSKYLTLARAD